MKRIHFEEEMDDSPPGTKVTESRDDRKATFMQNMKSLQLEKSPRVSTRYAKQDETDVITLIVDNFCSQA